MVNWKKKLTSRKFWTAVAGFVAPLLLAFGVDESTATEVTALIMAGATVIAYIIGEGLVDATYNSGNAGGTATGGTAGGTVGETETKTETETDT